MRKKGAKGAPKASDFAAAKRTAKKATGGPVGKVVKGIKKTTKKGGFVARGCGAIMSNRKKKTRFA